MESEANGHPREEGLLVRIRRPRLSDGESVWRLVHTAAPGLLRGSRHLLEVLIQRFANLSLIAEADGRVVGFVGAHRPEVDRRTLIIWQIDVEPPLRQNGLGTALLHALLESQECDGVEHVEANVAASNLAAMRLFERFAREVDARCESTPRSPADALASDQNNREELLRVGPIRLEHVRSSKGSHETL